MAGSANAGLTLSYGYLSEGTKTSAIIGTGVSAEGLKYRGSFVYELKDGVERLSSVGWSEGRTEYVYAPSLVEDGDEVLEGPEELLEIDDLWYVPDHLGNVRAVVLMDYSGGTVLEQNEYLPFGTRLDGTLALPENRYRLGGKEEQRFGGLDLALSDFGARFYDPFSARWTTRDPLAGKYHSLSPYNYCAGNPVNMVDAFGADLYIFDEEGAFQTKIQMEGEHRLVVNTKDNRGNITATFYDFADPENDPADIEKGIINQVKFVSDEDIIDMISGQGGFNANKMNFGFRSMGGHQYDYSYTVLRSKYSAQETIGSETTLYSRFLFIPQGDNTAHNLMNFGNYLWAVTGQLAGFSLNALKRGAQINSLFNSRRNGYMPQLDSADDQESIRLGYSHAKKNKYRSKR